MAELGSNNRDHKAKPKTFTIWPFTKSDSWGLEDFIKLGGQEKSLERSMYSDMKSEKRALFSFKLGCPTTFSLRNSQTTVLTVLVPTTSPPTKESKWHTSAIIHPEAKFPKYRNFDSNRNISKRLYMKTRRGIIVITPRVSFFSQRLHMLFWF